MTHTHTHTHEPVVRDLRWAVRLPRRPTRSRVASWALALFAIALFLVAIQVLREGAGVLGVLLRNHLRARSSASTLGLGWLASYLILSGSPIAAAALAIFDRGALTERQCFTMVVGTRFGAIFVALALSALYTLTGRKRRSSLRLGLLAFLTTQVIAWLSLAIGLLLLPLGLFRVQFPFPVLRAVNDATMPLAHALSRLFPGWAVFLIGLAGVLASFKLIDHALPPADELSLDAERLAPRLQSPLFMFAMGLLITFFTPSVTISVGLLVPLYAKGYIDRARLVPYIMGANITTFSDTLAAALVLGNPSAVNVVATEIVSITIASLALIFALYEPVERLLVRATEELARSRRALLVFLALIFAVPLALLLY